MDRTPKGVVSVGEGTITLLAAALLIGGFCARPASALVDTACNTQQVRTSPTIYVRSSGNDANDGGAAATALRSIGCAAAVAKAGAQVVVGPGIYHEGNITPTAFARVSFLADRRGSRVGEPAGDVVIDASQFASGFLLNHNLAINIDGFVIYGAVNGIYVKSRSDQAVVTNNIVSNSSDNGIYIQDSPATVVFNNLVYNNGWSSTGVSNGGSGILIASNGSGSPAVHVINNTVYKNANRGIFFSGTTGDSSGGLTLNNITLDNGGNGIQVNPIARNGYVSAGNVFADRIPSGTPLDVTDRAGDPLFVNPPGVDGSLGGPGYADDDFHLSAISAGQSVTSPAVDTGSDLARRLKLTRSSTRTDGAPDLGLVDAGYHYGNFGAHPTRPAAVIRYASLYVNPTTGADGNDGRSPAFPLRSLARAFQLARSGDRVWMQPGTYSEGNLILMNSGVPGRPIVIQGKPGARIDASGFTRAILLSGQTDVTLVTLDISGGSDGIEIRNNASNITLRRCHLHDNTTRGLYVNGSTHVLLRSSTIDHNGARGVQVDGADLDIDRSVISANGIQGVWAINNSLVAVTATRLTDNQKSAVLTEQSEVSISDSAAQGGSDGAVRFTQNSTGTVTRVTVTGSPDAGIQGISSVVNVTDSVVEDNTRVGIEGIVDTATLGSNEMTITRTRVCNNQGPGVHMQQTGATLTDVTLCQNGAEGVRQENGSLQMRGGAATQNKSKGIAITTADEVMVQDTHVVGNGDRGVQVLSSKDVSISGTVTGANANDGLVVLDSSAPVITNNLVYGNAAQGILVAGDIVGSPNAQVLNNTVYASGNRGVVIGGSNQAPPSNGAVVLRNIFQGNASFGLQVNELSIPGFTGDYNLSVDPYPDLTRPGTHDVLVADALFVAPTSSTPDFHLQQRAAGQRVTSPAVDAGGIDVAAAGLQGTSTRSDGVADSGTVDLGFHYPFVMPTPIPTPQATATSVAVTPTASRTPPPVTATSVPATGTPTRTRTPVPPTPTALPSATSTPQPPTPTNTPVPATPTTKATSTATDTPTPTASAVPTDTATPTDTAAPPTATDTPVPPPPTDTPVAPTSTQTAAPTDTPMPTSTAMPTDTASPTTTPAPTDTLVPTITATATDTPTPTVTSVVEPTDSPTPSP